MSNANKEIEKMSKIILSKLETATSAELLSINYAKKIQILSDLNYTKKVLQEIQKASSKRKGDIEKKAVIKTLLYSTWIYRLYFIIRASLMGLLSMITSLSIVAVTGTVALTGIVFLGIMSFMVALVVTRYFDAQIVWVTKKLVRHLADHEKLRDFIMNNF